MATPSRGILIVFEGIDGSGKTTLATLLANALSKKGLPVILTKQPGATALGKCIRSLLHEQTAPLYPVAEFLLFAADRAQHIHEIVKPALQQRQIVISDRMADSSYAYQGYGRNLDLDKIQHVNSWALQGISPNIIFYLRITAQEAFKRIEKEHRDFFERVIQGFEDNFKDRTDVVTLDAHLAPEKLLSHVLDALQTVLSL
jgi:dTMP kinase